MAFFLPFPYENKTGQETGDHINGEVKTLEGIVENVRKSMGITKAAKFIHDHYMEFMRDIHPFSDEDEWTREMIEDHLCRHAAPEAVARGERPGEDMVSHPPTPFFCFVVACIDQRFVPPAGL